MKKITLSYLLTFFVAISFSKSLTEPVDTNKVFIIKMENGEDYKGRIIQQNSTRVILKTKNEEWNLETNNIKSIEVFDYNGKFSYKNTNDNRYFYGPTAISLEKGKGYYQNIVVLNSVSYGITENISIGGGFELFSILKGESPFWYLTSKAGFKLKEKINVGAGLLVTGSSNFKNAEFAAIGYGIFTYGSSDSNFSVGFGYGFQKAKTPAVFLAGSNRIGNNLVLLSENYLIPTGFDETYHLGTHGIRILGKRNSFDFGLLTFNNLFQNEFNVLPYGSYVRVF